MAKYSSSPPAGLPSSLQPRDTSVDAARNAQRVVVIDASAGAHETSVIDLHEHLDAGQDSGFGLSSPSLSSSFCKASASFPGVRSPSLSRSASPFQGSPRKGVADGEEAAEDARNYMTTAAWERAYGAAVAQGRNAFAHQEGGSGNGRRPTTPNKTGGRSRSAPSGQRRSQAPPSSVARGTSAERPQFDHVVCTPKAPWLPPGIAPLNIHSGCASGSFCNMASTTASSAASNGGSRPPSRGAAGIGRQCSSCRQEACPLDASSLPPQDSMAFAERWVASVIGAKPKALAAEVAYPGQIVVRLEDFAQSFAPLAAANAALRERMIGALEDGSFLQAALRIYYRFDKDGGSLSWTSGEIRSFITQVFWHYALVPPTHDQMQQLYMRFDQTRHGRLEPWSCVALADVLVRAVISPAATQAVLSSAAGGGGGGRSASTKTFRPKGLLRKSVGSPAAAASAASDGLSCAASGPGAENGVARRSVLLKAPANAPSVSSPTPRRPCSPPPVTSRHSQPRGPASAPESPGRDISESSELRQMPSQSDADKWTPEEVAHWAISSLGLPQSLGEHLVKEEIHGPVLLSLVEEDLCRLGVEPFGRRRQLLLGIEVLKSAVLRGEKLERPERLVSGIQTPLPSGAITPVTPVLAVPLAGEGGAACQRQLVAAPFAFAPVYGVSTPVCPPPSATMVAERPAVSTKAFSPSQAAVPSGASTPVRSSMPMVFAPPAGSSAQKRMTVMEPIVRPSLSSGAGYTPPCGSPAMTSCASPAGVRTPMCATPGISAPMQHTATACTTPRVIAPAARVMQKVSVMGEQ